MRDSRMLCLLVVVLAASMLLAGSSVALRAAGCPSELVSSRAQTWLQRAGQAPHSPEELERIPADLREAVLTLLPPEVKSELWAGALRTYLADHSHLTPDQAQLIRDTIDLVTPEYFSLHPGDPGWRELVDRPTLALAKRGRALFSRPEFQTVFIDMNGVLARASEPATTVPATPLCACSGAWQDCPLQGSICQSAACTIRQGCGPMRRYWCDGICFFGG